MKKAYFFFAFIWLTHWAVAQQLSISGIVTDAQSGETMPGVSVSEKGTTNGTTTNAAGEYTLSLSQPGGVVVFGFLGYATREEPTAGRNIINVALSAQALELGEVVVTALGTISYISRLPCPTVQKIDHYDISFVKSVNFIDNLAGRVAGVTVTQGATGVGSTSKVVIRGESSFSNNNPLFVVDGIPINNNSIVNIANDDAAGFQSVDFGNGAMDINPDDIASVTVLKGAATAALYGTRAANGVILITTKSGAGDEGLGISFNSTTFFERPFQLPQFQNKYGQGNSGLFAFKDGLGGGTNDNISYSWGPALDQGLLIAQFDSPVTAPTGQVVRGGDVAVHGGAPITPTPFVSHPDNLKDFYQTGTTAINNIAVSSSSDRGNFRLSLTDLRSKSVIPGVNLDRKTAAIRLTFRPVSKLSISSSLNYVNTQSANRPSSGYGSENTNYAIVAWGPRSLNIGSLEDYWQPGLEGLQHYSFNYTFFDNPYFTLLENRNSLNRDRLIGNVSATYDLNRYFNVSLRTGMDYSNELRQFRRAFSSNRFKRGAYAEQTVFYRENNTDLLLRYNRTLGDLRVEVTAGANRMDQEASQVQTQTQALAQAGVFSLANAASPLEIISYRARKRINSVYGAVNLGYRNFLYLDISGRNDWSSALATPQSAANASFFYPALSANLILSEMLKLPDAFTFVKLSASLAQVGNDTNPYQTAGVFVAATPYASQPTFTDQSLIANTNLLPERNTSYELGAMFNFYNSRLGFDVTYYNGLTENQIISLPIAASSGYRQQVVNGGSVRSQGWEAVLSIMPIQQSRFKWNMVFNFSRNIATVESLPGGIDRLTLAYSRVYDNVNQTVWFQVEEGGRIGDMYGTGYKKNENGEFILTAAGNYIADNTLIKLGNYNPDFMLGISNQLNYKNWGLGFVFDWRQGGILVSRTLALAAVGGQLIETAHRPTEGIIAQGVVNTGSAENPVYTPNTTAISAESYYRQYYDRNHEENNTYNGSYLKLRELSIVYTLKPEYTKALRFLDEGSELSVALVGRNLFAISEIPHFDPEQLALQGQQYVNGVEDMSYATTRSLGIKLGINF